MSQIREPCYFYTQKAASYVGSRDYEIKYDPGVFVVFSEDFYPLDDDKYQSCLCRSLNLANEYNTNVSYSDKEDLAKAIYFDLYQKPDETIFVCENDVIADVANRYFGEDSIINIKKVIEEFEEK